VIKNFRLLVNICIISTTLSCSVLPTVQAPSNFSFKVRDTSNSELLGDKEVRLKEKTPLPTLPEKLINQRFPTLFSNSFMYNKMYISTGDLYHQPLEDKESMVKLHPELEYLDQTNLFSGDDINAYGSGTISLSEDGKAVKGSFGLLLSGSKYFSLVHPSNPNATISGSIYANMNLNLSTNNFNGIYQDVTASAISEKYITYNPSCVYGWNVKVKGDGTPNVNANFRNNQIIVDNFSYSKGKGTQEYNYCYAGYGNNENNILLMRGTAGIFVNPPKINVSIKVADQDKLKFPEPITSPRNQDNKYDKAEIKVKTLPDDQWIMWIEGKDEDGRNRYYESKGTGTQSILFNGKTNDAEKEEDNVYFSDGELSVKVISTKYAILQDLGVVKEARTLKWNDSSNDSGVHPSFKTDNTAPSVSIQNSSIERDVLQIQGDISDQSGLDVSSYPLKINRTATNSQDISSEQTFHSTIDGNTFNGYLVGVTDLDDKESLENLIKVGIYTRIKDIVGNTGSNYDGTTDIEIGDEESSNSNENSDFSTKNVDLTKAPPVKTGTKKKGLNPICFIDKAANLLNKLPAYPYEIGSGKPFIVKVFIGRCPNTWILPFETVKINGVVRLLLGQMDTSTKKVIIKKVQLKDIHEDVIFTQLAPALVGDLSYWFGSVRNDVQKSNAERNFLGQSTFWNLYYNSSTQDGINQTFAGPPFATSGVGKVIVDLNIYREYSSSPEPAHIEYTFNIKNEHPDYNDKFENGNRNPYKVTDYLKYHIKERHSFEIFNPSNFIKAYIAKYGEKEKDREKALKEFSELKKRNTNFKGTCWKKDKFNSHQNEIFKAIDDIVNMKDIKDKFGTEKEVLIISGKREINAENHYIDTLLSRVGNEYVFGNKPKSGGEDDAGSAFPNKYDSWALNIDQVNTEMLNMRVDELEKAFENYLASTYAKKGQDLVKSVKSIQDGDNNPNGNGNDNYKGVKVKINGSAPLKIFATDVPSVYSMKELKNNKLSPR
jgi:hypothetical protein